MKPNARSVLTALGKIDHFELKARKKPMGCWVFFVCLGNLNYIFMSVSKNRGKPPKMDGENNVTTLLKWDDLGGFTTPIFGNTLI